MQCGGTCYNLLIRIAALTVFCMIAVILLQAIEVQVKIGHRNLQVCEDAFSLVVAQNGHTVIGDGDIDGHGCGGRFVIAVLCRIAAIRLGDSDRYGVAGSGACLTGSGDDRRVITRLADGEVQFSVGDFCVFPKCSAAQRIGQGVALPVGKHSG